MQLTIDQLNSMLLPQGFRVTPFANDLAEDVKLRPTPAEEVERRYLAAAEALALLHEQIAGANAFSVCDIADVFDVATVDDDTRQLAGLFTSHGSDKATIHNYHIVYGNILAGKRDQDIRILEIGLGTNNIDTLSNMGRAGRPGASLRSFRDWAPRAQVFGADIDERILFTEERIQTFFVDQTDHGALNALAARFSPKSFDLIIDDGLHIPEANFKTTLAMLPLVADNGCLVIEDIVPETAPLWNLAFNTLAAAYQCQFLRTQAACLVIVRRKQP